uniref:Uncharacterized protein n=1 Tax=Anguilla anguilla TaxID=7936 RepID=A0A0E9QQ40_ANGAN
MLIRLITHNHVTAFTISEVNRNAFQWSEERQRLETSFAAVGGGNVRALTPCSS